MMASYLAEDFYCHEKKPIAGGGRGGDLDIPCRLPATPTAPGPWPPSFPEAGLMPSGGRCRDGVVTVG